MQVEMCSTPFGIYGIVTGRFLADDFLGHCVLNAFRHLRNCHRCVASRSSAQPLYVLNAFRHLRNCHRILAVLAARCRTCSTPFGIYGIVTAEADQRGQCLLVLNAFRHLRNCHDLKRSVFPIACQQCSTPFGIYGIVTDGSLSASRRTANVLNAFRHLRNCHTVCQWLRTGSLGAQRLSASTELSPSYSRSVTT